MSRVERNQSNPYIRKETKKRPPKKQLKHNPWEIIKNMRISTEAAQRRSQNNLQPNDNPQDIPKEATVQIEDQFLKGLGFYESK